MRESAAAGAELALAFLEAGVVGEPEAGSLFPQDAIEAALSRWWEGVPLPRFLVPTCAFAEGAGQAAYFFELDGDCFDEELAGPKGAAERRLFFGMGVAISPEWCLEEGMARWEAILPGLYQTALFRLYRAAERSTFFATPPLIEDLCCELCWSGEDDEDLVVEEETADGKRSAEEVRSEMVTRADFDAAFPPALVKPEDLFSDADLSLVAGRGGEAGRLAAALLSLEGGWFIEPEVPERFLEQGRRGEWAGRLRRREDDFAQRVLDELDDFVANNGGTHTAALYLADPEPASIRAALSGVESYCRMLARIEGVLDLVARRRWP